MISVPKKHLFYFLLCIAPQSIILAKSPIKAICFDIETIFETDNMKASSYVGKVSSLQYATRAGHLPCQEDLFAQLMKVPAKSINYTYNNDLKMPLIFSDWLTNMQSQQTLLTKTLAFLDDSKLSNVEKKVLGNIVTMMLTPSALTDTQKVIRSTEKLIIQLRQNGYKVYLTGNWAHIDSLRENFSATLGLFHGIFVSGKMHMLKPYQEFYDLILQKINLTAADVLWIEKESTFVSKIKTLKLNALHLDPKHAKHFISELHAFGINA